MNYHNLPFAVIIIDSKDKSIIYMNNKFMKLFDILDNCTYDNVSDLEGLKPIANYLNKNLIEEKELRLEIDNEYYNIVLNPVEDTIEVFFIKFDHKELSQNIRLEKERDTLLDLSLELKGKCEIIEVLRKREKDHFLYLKNLINNISEGIIVLDENNTFSFCNKAAYEITGISPGELLNFSVLRKQYLLSDVMNSHASLDNYEKKLREHMPLSNLVVKLKNKNNHNLIYVEINSSPIFNKGQFIYTIITVKDITESRQNQLIAEEHSKFIQKVVDTIGIPICVVEYPNLKIRLMNKKGKNLTECLKGESIENKNLEKMSINDIFSDNEKDILEEIHTAIEGEKLFSSRPIEVKNKNNSIEFIRINCTPFRRNGNSGFIYLHATDVTKEINSNIELENITKVKDEFFTLISHELRTPLTIINSSLQLVDSIYKHEVTPNIRKTINRIKQNSSRLLKLTNNILDISKAETGFLEINLSSFDIVELTEYIVNSVNLYAQSKNIDLIFDTNEEEAEVFLDKDKYEKILLNLLSNAIKYTPYEEISEDKEKKKIDIIIQVNRDDFTVSVKDQGIGIPEEKLSTIFDRYAQVNNSLSRGAEGTGLGLALVKKLIELMNGKVQVISEEGLGSEFIVTFNRRSGENKGNLNRIIENDNTHHKVSVEFSDVY